MNEITRVVLENEMDLILAHKQSMRLAELAGLSLSAQTTLATAVSEVSRNAIITNAKAELQLYVSDKKDLQKYITAVLLDNRKEFSPSNDEGYSNARRLVANIKAERLESGNRIELQYGLPYTLRIDEEILEKWRVSLNTDPDISPYEEIKRKNRQLLEMSARLSESEQQYRSLTNSLPIMIYSMTPQGEITYANQWLTDYSGETVEELNISKWKEVVHPDDFGKIWDWQQSPDDPVRIIVAERRLRNAGTGEYRWHTGTSIAVTEDDGSVVKCWNTFMVDIHAQKMIEETLRDNIQLKQTQAQLEDKINQLDQSNRQLEQFAYVASHDLQEPLRKISFYGDYLKTRYRDTFSDEAALFFDNMLNATSRMKVLINDVLTYSIITADTKLNEIVNLDQVLAEALLDFELTITEKGAIVTSDHLPIIEGNYSQIRQLFDNILSNALKYTAAGRPPVINIKAETAGANVILEFKDNGIGFDDVFLEKIFNLFQRLHTKDKFGGTGIGLAICKKITEVHRGTITAHSAPGAGATFIVTLPAMQIIPDN